MNPPSYTIQYHVTKSKNTPKQVLRIWETDPGALHDEDAILYQINYELDETSGAHQVINHLLEAAGAQRLTPYQFEKLKGKLKVNPNPTLRLFPQT